MSLTHLRRFVAAGEHTATVSLHQSSLNRRGHQPTGPAHIQRFGVGTEDHRQDLGVTGQPSQLACSEPVTVREQTSVMEALTQRFLGDGDHQPRPARHSRAALVAPTSLPQLPLSGSTRASIVNRSGECGAFSDPCRTGGLRRLA